MLEKLLIDILKGGIGQIIVIALVLAFLYSTGVLQFIREWVKQNGKNGKDKTDLAEEIASALANNHFHKVIESSEEVKLILKEILDETREHNRTETPMLQELSKGIAIIQAKQNGK